MSRALLLAAAAVFVLPSFVAAQGDGGAPVIDSIVIVTDNVFGEAEARNNAAFRIANAIRFKTRGFVVRRELLFKAGEPYDSAKVAETERNLRRLGIFRGVAIDSVTFEGRFYMLVRTADGWSTQLTLNGRTTGSTFTWVVGASETNFIGTSDFVSFSYRQDTDRNAFTLGYRSNRFVGSRLAVGGFIEDRTDGVRGGWAVGYPFRSMNSRWGAELEGEAADHRVLQYIVRSVTDQDTVRYQRRAFFNRLTTAYAPIAESSHYVRIGLLGQVKREEILLRSDTLLAIPDTVTVAVGVFADFRRANFKTVSHFNGFAQTEDLDLSTIVGLTVWAAPSGFGYDRTGIGPRIVVATGASIPSGYLRLQAVANGLFNGAGLDSGRVAASLTVGTQFFSKQATFLHVRGGLLERPSPGSEFDLGHGIGPRSFGPHAFTGDRNVWGTIEHRMFLIDDFLGVLGLGFAAFLDYGGAWFDGFEPQHGGNIGFGLRTGGSRASGPSLGRIDLAYQFGDGRSGGRWVISTGRGLSF